VVMGALKSAHGSTAHRPGTSVTALMRLNSIFPAKSAITSWSKRDPRGSPSGISDAPCHRWPQGNSVPTKRFRQASANTYL